MIQLAYEEWARLPMPQVDEEQKFEKSKFELEEDAIRNEIRWVAKKYGVTFKELDDYIESRSKEIA